MKKNLRLLLPPFISLTIILLTSAVIIAYGKGYRPGKPTNGDQIIRATGLLSTTSDPVGAQVFVDNELKTATNNSINIDPGTKTIKISKEGYLSWQKDIKIDSEIVSRADAFLFPINPSLSPLTNTGIVNPTLSDDGNRIAYLIPPKDTSLESQERSGLWVYDLVDRPLGFNRDPRKIGLWQNYWVNDIPTLLWSPDSQELVVKAESEVRLYNVGRTDDFTIITNTLRTTQDEWSLAQSIKQSQQLSAFKQPFINIATSSARIIAFSPDESKVLYQATSSATLEQIITPPLIGSNNVPESRTIEPNSLYVYDSKEDKNYFLLKTSELVAPTPTPTKATKTKQSPVVEPESEIMTDLPIRWFPTNRHLVINLSGKIDILEYDRTNWVTVYAGPFQENFVAPWPGGSRLIIVSNLNPGASPLPNLFSVNLR